MSTFLNRTAYDPFASFFSRGDLLFKNVFESHSDFDSILGSKLNYPVDISETEKGLLFEVAVVGLDKKDVSIKTEGNVIRISYTKSESKEETVYLHKGISRRSFDFSFKVSSRYDLSKLKAKMEKGLLLLEVPFAPNSEPKEVKID